MKISMDNLFIFRIHHIDEWDFWKRELYKSLAAFWGKSGEPDFLT